MQKKVISLFNIFSNKLNNLVDSSNKENIISYCQIRNAMSLQLLIIRRNSGVGLIEINKCTSRKNENTRQFKIKEVIRGANMVISDISFFYQRIIICN